ncbi:hypothetical protein GH714_031497 [Hevea brasiliensis]|uniref:Protein kinase domain-containing protein n=1 Tax=Hevea brasiliensis TaxID=3981 RepID=A0A6A6L184_HEVBR|nr:hypothetical protein GH714_031497 [Hevea brasiliensis]
MAISLFSLPSLQAPFLLLFYVSATYVTAQSQEFTDFLCSADVESRCRTYIAYLAQPPNFLNLGNISDLFSVSRLEIASASNLVSEDTPLIPNQLLLVPVACGCTGNHSFANITYRIKQGDSYYFVSTTSFENLTNWEAVEVLNPNLDPNLLYPGDKAIFPLFCKCPSKTHMKNGIQYLITYVWQPDDDVLKVAAKLNASPHDIAIENNYQNFSVAKKKMMTLYRNGSCLETVDLLQTKELKQYDSFEPKIIQDKLLPGVSGYLGKPIMYEVKAIMMATMDLHEHYRIGGSVYRANINGQVLAVKKTKEDVTEELKILQKVNHANLVKLIGISSNADGNCFLVYEYAENGSLDKWLYLNSASPSSFVAFLSWSQRLHIALDVASGLQYMHEHIQPSIVHMDIRTNVFAFGVVLLELLSGKKAMVTKANGEISLLWKEMKDVLEVAERRVERLKKWMDPNLESFYPIDGALSLANLARACTLDKSSARPSMAEIVFNLTVLTQSSPETLEKSWTSGLDAEDIQITSPVIAR